MVLTTCPPSVVMICLLTNWTTIGANNFDSLSALGRLLARGQGHRLNGHHLITLVLSIDKTRIIIVVGVIMEEQGYKSLQGS